MAIAPPSEQPIAPAAATPAATAPDTPAVLSRSPALAAPDRAGTDGPSPDRATGDDSVRLRRELEATSRSLAEAERSLADERDKRRAAERTVDQLTAAQARPTASKAERSASARATRLEGEVAALRKKLAAAEGEAARARGELESGAARRSELESQLAEVSGRAERAEKALAQNRSQHQRTLEGESEAVRKLVADLEREKAARREAERKLLEVQAGATRPPRESTAAGPAAQAAARVSEPERIKTVPPRYPDELRQLGVAGRVMLRLLVDESGKVVDVQVTNQADERLGAVAAAAARQWEYTPGRRDGMRVRMWVTEAVDFKL
jgi:TonB family protein